MKTTILALAIISVFVMLSVRYPHTMLNPGELVQGHQDLKEKCLSCHTPFSGVPNDKCIACHKLADIGKETTALGATSVSNSKIAFHEKLANQQCTACHTDHNGLNPESSLSGFNHEMLSAEMANNCIGCHQKPGDKLHGQISANCKSCHNTNGWALATKFDHAMLQGVEKNNCAGCHQSPGDAFHGSIKDNCDKCHSTDKWTPATFEHSSYFVLDENHDAKCAVCHLANNYNNYTCYGCHEHTESNIRGEHNEEGIYNFTDCVSCHRSGNEHDIRSNGKDGERRNESAEDDHDD